MANKGMNLEKLIEYSNTQYKNMGLSNTQKISTPWTVIRAGKEIVSAFPSGQSTLDFRGTVKGGFAISFDCKESANEKGLPLSHIKQHQIDYIETAIALKETSFIICEIKPIQKQYLIPGKTVIEHWNNWQANKGKRGYNIIPVEKMKEIPKSKRAVACDYLALFKI